MDWGVASAKARLKHLFDMKSPLHIVFTSLRDRLPGAFFMYCKCDSQIKTSDQREAKKGGMKSPIVPLSRSDEWKRSQGAKRDLTAGYPMAQFDLRIV